MRWHKQRYSRSDNVENIFELVSLEGRVVHLMEFYRVSVVNLFILHTVVRVYAIFNDFFCLSALSFAF